MSADNAIFVQKNKQGLFVAQHWFMSNDDMPDPEKAAANHTFSTLGELIETMAPEAADTEYGFEFFINFKEQPGYGTVDYQTQT